LFDETGRLIKGKECQFRVREGDPRAPEVRKIAVWPDLYHSDEDYPPPEDE
jgi:hypothetical protein